MTSRWLDSDAPRGDDYDARWRAMAAAGQNPHGEADFVERFAPRTVLDAGCGTGRVAIELTRRGIRCVGVDLDARMLGAARRNAPQVEWHESDLTTFDLRDDHGAPRRFDVAVAAGNVMIFLAPGSEATAVARVAAHLTPGGRFIAGFQLGGGRLPLDAFDAAAAAAGLELESRHATWDGAPFVSGGYYAVSVHRRTDG